MVCFTRKNTKYKYINTIYLSSDFCKFRKGSVHITYASRYRARNSIAICYKFMYLCKLTNIHWDGASEVIIVEKGSLVGLNCLTNLEGSH